MISEINWKGIEFDSLEKCHVSISEGLIRIDSVITSERPNNFFTARYGLELNHLWETKKFSLEFNSKGNTELYFLESLDKGRWKFNDQFADHFSSCIDIDLPLTPFTNSLPINRLSLEQDEEAIIQVIYFDIMGDGISVKKQLYRRLNTNMYYYQNIPNDFAAEITVDKNGFVLNYPRLFERIHH